MVVDLEGGLISVCFVMGMVVIISMFLLLFKVGDYIIVS